jgi:hypothetical protein
MLAMISKIFVIGTIASATDALAVKVLTRGVCQIEQIVKSLNTLRELEKYKKES